VHSQQLCSPVVQVELKALEDEELESWRFTPEILPTLKPAEFHLIRQQHHKRFRLTQARRVQISTRKG
jgi:hypothetical protein